MQVGDPIRDGWSLYARFWQHLLPIALVVYLVISTVTLVFATLGRGLGGLIALAVSVAGIFLLQAALVEAVNDVRDGRADLTLSETLTRVLPRLGSVALAGILAGLAVAVGFIFLLVPGLFLLTIWSAVVPVIVLENAPALESFGRSRALVRGYGWTVFGVILATGLIVLVAEIVLGIVFHSFSRDVDQYLTSVIANTVIAPFVATTWTSMYFRLKALHEPAVAVPSGAATSDA